MLISMIRWVEWVSEFSTLVFFFAFFSDATYQKMLVQLAQCEFAIGKTQTVFEMNELETENYEKIYREIGKCK